MPGNRAADSAQKRAAVAQLYESHYARVARYIAVRIGSLAEAEDLASEVFVRALRSADSYRDTGAPMEAWIFRIAHNIVVDHLRRKSRRPAPVPLEETSAAASAHGDPTANLDAQQEVAQLHQAIEKLSKAQQQVLALRFGAQMTSEQAAAAMGKRPGAVREMQSAAIKRLRQLLGEA